MRAHGYADAFSTSELGSRVAAALQDGLWLTVETIRSGGPRGRIWQVRDGDGVPLLEARTFAWRRSFSVNCAATQRPLLTVRSRRLFPVTGRADVLRVDGVAGAVFRNGRFMDASRRFEGRFRDARTTREHVRESVLQTAFELALDSDGSGEPSSPAAFVCTIGGRSAGLLRSRRRPEHWDPEPARGPGVLPGRLRKWLGAALSARGWQLQVDGVTDAEQALLLTSAALFTIDLRRA